MNESEKGRVSRYYNIVGEGGGYCLIHNYDHTGGLGQQRVLGHASYLLKYF